MQRGFATLRHDQSARYPLVRRRRQPPLSFVATTDDVVVVHVCTLPRRATQDAARHGTMTYQPTARTISVRAAMPFGIAVPSWPFLPLAASSSLSRVQRGTSLGEIVAAK